MFREGDLDGLLPRAAHGGASCASLGNRSAVRVQDRQRQGQAEAKRVLHVAFAFERRPEREIGILFADLMTEGALRNLVLGLA
jgi:hypothetical protein